MDDDQAALLAANKQALARFISETSKDAKLLTNILRTNYADIVLRKTNMYNGLSQEIPDRIDRYQLNHLLQKVSAQLPSAYNQGIAALLHTIELLHQRFEECRTAMNEYGQIPEPLTHQTLLQGIVYRYQLEQLDTNPEQYTFEEPPDEEKIKQLAHHYYIHITVDKVIRQAQYW